MCVICRKSSTYIHNICIIVGYMLCKSINMYIHKETKEGGIE